MKKKILEIENLSEKEQYELINQICSSDLKLSLEEIKKILNVSDKNLIDEFLRNYILFDKDDKKYLEEFVNSNLSHGNKSFVSDLIYFSSDLSLNIDYEKILDLIRIKKIDENYVVSGCLIYISSNIKYYYIEKIFENLIYVRDHVIYFQSAQILASLCLYRITLKKSYLNFIKELIKDDNGNYQFLQNILKEEMYDKNFFDLTEIKKLRGKEI